jgi:hypothetical protein
LRQSNELENKVLNDQKDELELKFNTLQDKYSQLSSVKNLNQETEDFSKLKIQLEKAEKEVKTAKIREVNDKE